MDIQLCATKSCNDEFELLIYFIDENLQQQITINLKLQTQIQKDINWTESENLRRCVATCLPDYLSLLTRSLRGLLRAF